MIAVVFTVMLAVLYDGGEVGTGGAFLGNTVIFEVNGADAVIDEMTGYQKRETVPVPVIIEKNGSFFDGWYSTEIFDDGTLWVFGD